MVNEFYILRSMTAKTGNVKSGRLAREEPPTVNVALHRSIPPPTKINQARTVESESSTSNPPQKTGVSDFNPWGRWMLASLFLWR